MAISISNLSMCCSPILVFYPGPHITTQQKQKQLISTVVLSHISSYHIYFTKILQIPTKFKQQNQKWNEEKLRNWRTPHPINQLLHTKNKTLIFLYNSFNLTPFRHSFWWWLKVFLNSVKIINFRLYGYHLNFRFCTFFVLTYFFLFLFYILCKVFMYVSG